ncbi:hypothetical protein FHR81_001555 [Actinoalloteichus hoggarensis]|uniref:Uncharacterized protein n=1 Tax=Actinoalloteichus hoggarensis TaxID=1470176 RepID=A0A221W0J6_9PSEU|nr:DUF3558 domain-containing protein [Actinoalloteichus hoggarensis]ASO19287.1 hypothetical protein AHOG_08210 [Actinoalloteichus hoggarensis]MBB5920525.1 hypothetical protein [Actinoalloteichus hoggarensis]
MSQRSLTTAISALLLVLGLGACATPVAGTASPAPGAGGSRSDEAQETGSDTDETSSPSIPIPDPTTPTPDSGGSGGGGGAKNPGDVEAFCGIVDAAAIAAAVGSSDVGEANDYSTTCSYSIELDGTSHNYLGFGVTYWGEEVREDGEEDTEILGHPGYRLVDDGRCEFGAVVNEDPSVVFNTIYVDLDTFGDVSRDLCTEAEAVLSLIYDAVPAA